MDIVRTLILVTAYSAVIFVAILLLKLCFGKLMSAALHYALWFVLVARLLVPVTIDSGVHLFTLPAAPAAQTALEAGRPAGDGALLTGGSAPVNAGPAGPTAFESPAGTASPTARTKLTPAHIAAAVWAAGVAGFGVWLIVLYAALLLRIRKNRARPSRKLLLLLSEVKAELNIASPIRLVCLYEYGTPALLFPNVVLMPIDALSAMNAEQIRFALRHELMHFKRGDQLMSILLSALGAVYWFNPVVWIAARMMRADMETACDGMVTRRLTHEQRNDYASLILHLFAQPERRRIALGMAQSATRKMAEQRVRGIYMRRSSGRGAKAACLFAAVLLAFGCFTTACVPVAGKAAAQPAESGAVDLSAGAASDDGAFTVTDTAGRTLRFTVADLGASAESDTEQPRGAVVSADTAARSAAAMLVIAFAGRVSDAVLYVRFKNHADLAMEQYQILAGGDTEDTAAFYCLADAGTGDVLYVQDLTADRGEARTDALDVDDPRWRGAGEACLAAGRVYAVERLTDGAEPLPDSYYDGVQATYLQEDPLTAAVYLHMEQGACYTLDIRYPSLTVTAVGIYRMGWDHCREMTFYDEYMEDPLMRRADSVEAALTPDQYALLANTVIMQIGKPFPQPGLTWQSGPYTGRFVHMMIEKALGGRAFGAGEAILIDSPDDPLLGDNCVLRLETANPQEDIYAVYIGNDDYVYADPATQTVVARSLREDWGTRLIDGTFINYGVYVPYRAFPSAESEAEYKEIAERAAEMIGKKLDVRAQDNKNPSYELLRLLFGCDEPVRDDDSQVSIWSTTDAALLPGKALFLYPGREVLESADLLAGVCLGGSKYAMLNPDTYVVELRDLAADFTSGLYSEVNCCIVFNPDGGYRTIAELSQAAPTTSP